MRPWSSVARPYLAEHKNRWLVAITILTIGSGWGGVALNTLLGEPHQMESPGTLLWLVTPLLLVLVARLFRKTVAPGRWAPRFRQAWPMYLVAVLAFPLVTVCSAMIGWLFGSIQFDGLRLPSLLPVAAAALAAGMVKNVFEEAVWRGYFTGEFDARHFGDWKVYLTVGIIWAAWHVPYYLFLLPEGDMRFILDVPRWGFALVAGLTMMAWGVLFTEVYRISGSIWPVVLLHAVEDATINPLVIDGHMRIAPEAAWLVSPIVGVLPAALLSMLGLALRHWRRSNVSREAAPLSDPRPVASVR